VNCQAEPDSRRNGVGLRGTASPETPDTHRPRANGVSEVKDFQLAPLYEAKLYGAPLLYHEPERSEWFMATSTRY